MTDSLAVDRDLLPGHGAPPDAKLLARARRLHHRRELDRLDFLRAVSALVASTAPLDLAGLIGLEVGELRAALRAAAATPQIPAGFSGASAYELAERYATAQLWREGLVDELGEWSFDPIDLDDPLHQDGDRTVAALARALGDGLLDDATYDEVMTRCAAAHRGARPPTARSGPAGPSVADGRWFALPGEPWAARARLHRQVTDECWAACRAVGHDRRAVVLAGGHGPAEDALVGAVIGGDVPRWLRVDPGALAASMARLDEAEDAASRGAYEREGLVMAAGLLTEAVRRGADVVVGPVPAKHTQVARLVERLDRAGYQVRLVELADAHVSPVGPLGEAAADWMAVNRYALMHPHPAGDSVLTSVLERRRRSGPLEPAGD